MHELSVCRALLREVASIARRHEVTSVTGVTVRIGPLSGVDIGLLTRAFRQARAGTAADGAELVVEPAPVRVRCSACGAMTDASVSRLLCAACGDSGTRLVGGDELLLVSVELGEPSERLLARDG